MDVGQLMVREVETCRPLDTLNTAAKIMWEHDCGCVPVVDDDARVVGILTDRDICMAAYTQGRPLDGIPVASVMTKDVHTCKGDDPIAFAEGIMRAHKVRRLPVTDADGHLLGILSLNDIARQAVRERTRKTKKAVSAAEVADILGAICEPRSAASISSAA
jgi:CBS domain-containing protein